MSEEVDALRARATELRQLAEDVDGLMNPAHTYVKNSMESWEGPNHDDVSGQLGSWKTECESVATSLRSLATGCDNDADALEAEEDDDEED